MSMKSSAFLDQLVSQVLPRAVRRLNGNMTLTFASWNQMVGWLRQIDGLRGAPLPRRSLLQRGSVSEVVIPEIRRWSWRFN